MMKLKTVRIYADLNQKDVAELLGVAYSSYNAWERENDFIPLRQLDKFCHHFHVSFDYVLGFSDVREYSDSKEWMDPVVLAKRLKMIRKVHDVTQDELAHILNITRSSISKYENGVNLALTSYLIGFCMYFHISADYITGKIDEEIKLEIEIKN